MKRGVGSAKRVDVATKEFAKGKGASSVGNASALLVRFLFRWKTFDSSEGDPRARGLEEVVAMAREEEG